jgi:hypothetical protein
MKTTKMTITIFALMVLSVVTVTTNVGCKGKDGAPGATGPQGNANVSSTTITSSSWTYSAPSWGMNLSFGAITQSIIDNGAVLVYVKTGNAFNQVPLTLYTSASYSSTIEVSTYAGGVTLIWTDSDLTQPNNPGSLTVKIVAIASRSMMAHTNVNFDDYNQVKNAFNLKD